MIMVSIAEGNEWLNTKKYYCINEISEYPYGEYFN